MAIETAEKLLVQLMMAHGSTPGSEQYLVNFSEDPSVTGNIRSVISVQLAAAGTGSVDLSTFCSVATWIAVQELNGVGLNIGFAGGVTPCQIAANGLYLFKNRNATPPVLYFQNPDGANKTAARVYVLGSYS